MRKIKNPWVGKEGYFCFGCAPENPLGLHMDFFEDGDDIVSFWKPDGRFQGWVNTLHGGIISTLIDEIAGWVVSRKLQTTGVTSRLDVRYRKPVLTTETQITLRARIVRQMRNVVVIGVTLENAKGEICDEAEATYFTFGHDKACEMGFTDCGLEGDELIPM